MKGDFLKMITNKNYNVYLASLPDKKLLGDFSKEMNFDVKTQGNESTRDRIFIKLLKSPALLVRVFQKQSFFSSDPNDLSDRLKFLLQEK